MIIFGQMPFTELTSTVQPSNEFYLLYVSSSFFVLFCFGALNFHLWLHYFKHFFVINFVITSNSSKKFICFVSLFLEIFRIAFQRWGQITISCHVENAFKAAFFSVCFKSARHIKILTNFIRFHFHLLDSYKYLKNRKNHQHHKQSTKRWSFANANRFIECIQPLIT